MSSPISGFTAIPNPQMLAFMPIQSYLMMYFAGAGWQIGKRKISAIPNEEFNKMSINDLLKGFTADLRETIPTLERSLNDITPLIKVLIDQYGDFLLEAIKVFPKTVEKVGKGIGEELFDIGKGSALDKLLHALELKNLLPEAAAHSEEVEATPTSKSIPAVANTEIGTATTNPLNLHQWKGFWRTKEYMERLIVVTGKQDAITIKEEAAINIAKISTPAVKKTLFKKAAGQSQKIAKAQFPKDIAILQRNVVIKLKEVQKQQKIFDAAPTYLKQQMQIKLINAKRFHSNVVKELKQKMQQLADLLARYKF